MMPPSSSLPLPDTEALAQSEQLLDRIRAALVEAGGWLPFSAYMDLALYTPGLGYYSGAAHKFGPQGDFITAPGLTALFGQTLARQVAQVLSASSPYILEVGAGTGALAADILLALEASDALPERYDILELSGELRARQAATLAAAAPHLVRRVQWLDALPTQFSGCLIANEVLDVMPVERIVWRDSAIFERGVTLDSDRQLTWQDRPARTRLQKIAQALPVPAHGEYVSEICPAANAWIRSWAERLTCGAMLLVDYGYTESEFYLPSRSHGTLQCYYRHRAHDGLLLWPGLNDITAFVDFTAIATTADDAGLSVLGYTSQAQFLHNCGLLNLLAARQTDSEADYIRAARAVNRLTGPHEMGELFKVLALGRGELPPLLGFTSGDKTHTL